MKYRVNNQICELKEIVFSKFRQFNDLPKTNALKPLAFSYGDTRRNTFRRANME
ncbi:hypothetical protein HpKG127_14890 [Helicobacter pylori]